MVVTQTSVISTLYHTAWVMIVTLTNVVQCAVKFVCVVLTLYQLLIIRLTFGRLRIS